MDIDEFMDSMDDEHPPEDWDKAHFIAQGIATAQGSAVHAYLHREEGVLWNADYWYRRAGRSRPDVPLHREWRSLVAEMLESA